MSQTNSRSCFLSLRPRTRPRARVVCFPFAGGGPTAFSSWARALPEDIELVAAQLPGRGAALNEKPFRRLADVVDWITPELEELCELPCAFFGHSLGALLAFELTRVLQKRGGRGPLHLFASGRRAPHLPIQRVPISHLPDDQFITAIRAFNGTPRVILDDPELMALFLPALRADLAIDESHRPMLGEPLACPLTALGGAQDPFVSHEQLRAWGSHARDAFECRVFQGDHFFIKPFEASVVAMILRALEPQGSVLENRDVRGLNQAAI